MITLILMVIASLLLLRLLFDVGIRAIVAFILILILCAIIGAVNVQAHEYQPKDIVDIGKVLWHEAPYESELGKRLVVDTILNRVESDEFPNTVSEVLSQPGQYCNPSKYPPDEIYQLVAEEIYTRTNDRVLWFRTKRYHSFGTPVIKEGSHYFSGEE